MTQPLRGEKPVCLNEFQCRPSQNTQAFILQAVLLSGEGLISPSAILGQEPKAQPGINPYLIPVYNAKAKLHPKGKGGSSKSKCQQIVNRTEATEAE